MITLLLHHSSEDLLLQECCDTLDKKLWFSVIWFILPESDKTVISPGDSNRRRLPTPVSHRLSSGGSTRRERQRPRVLSAAVRRGAGGGRAARHAGRHAHCYRR